MESGLMIGTRKEKKNSKLSQVIDGTIVALITGALTIPPAIFGGAYQDAHENLSRYSGKPNEISLINDEILTPNQMIQEASSKNIFYRIGNRLYADGYSAGVKDYIANIDISKLQNNKSYKRLTHI